MHREAITPFDPVLAPVPLHHRSARPTPSTLSDRLVGFAARAVLKCTARLPLRIAHGLGATLGNILGLLPTRSRTRCLRNLRTCLPGLGEREHRRLARRSLASMGRSLLELGALWKWDRERVLALATQVDGRHHLDEAIERGQGVVLVLPHAGSWEFAGHYLSSIHPLTVIYKPPSVLQIDRLITGLRGRLGARLVPSNLAGVKASRLALERRELVALLPDQAARDGGRCIVPLFGVRASTSTLPCRLARRTGASIVLAMAERLPRGRGFRVHFVRGSPELTRADVVTATAALNLQIQDLVLRRPDQYLWRYRRFRS